MGLSVSVINSCKLVDVKANSYGSPTAKIVFREIGSQSVHTENITYSGGVAQITVAVSNLDQPNGVYEVTLEESSTNVA